MYQAARHERLKDAWSNLRSQVYVFLLSRNVANPDFRDMMIQGHTDILDALRARDEKSAIEHMESHLLAAYQRIVQNYPSDDGNTHKVELPFGSLTPLPRSTRAAVHTQRKKARDHQT